MSMSKEQKVRNRRDRRQGECELVEEALELLEVVALEERQARELAARNAEHAFELLLRKVCLREDDSALAQDREQSTWPLHDRFLQNTT